MSTTTAARHVTFTTRALVIALAAFALALAAAISLPLTLRTTHTIYVRTVTSAHTSPRSAPTPAGRAETDSQTRIGDSIPAPQTDSQTRK
jgi:hypothetical protein